MGYCAKWTAVVLLVVIAGAPAAAQPSDRQDPATQQAYVEADVRFLQGMIRHHAQAVQMASLVRERTDRSIFHLVAERIGVSQRDEIAWMTSWLERHQESPPEVVLTFEASNDGPGHNHSEHRMPGMLGPDEMARLAEAEGRAFERLFLEGMIYHHRGALTMVENLLAAEGAAREPEIFRFASDVDADQRAEIRRMEAMLDELTNVGQD